MVVEDEFTGEQYADVFAGVSVVVFVGIALELDRSGTIAVESV